MSRKFVTTFTVAVGLFCLSLFPFSQSFADGGGNPAPSVQAQPCITDAILQKIFVYVDGYYPNYRKGQAQVEYKEGAFSISTLVCKREYEVTFLNNGCLIVVFPDI